jgi:tetratricopeptide (TPR) repeat protein
VESLIAERPGAADLQVYLAGLLQRAGRLDDALERLEQLEGSPAGEQGRVRYVLGRLYSEGGRKADAERILRSVPREDPAYADAQLALVQVLEEQKRTREALQSMRDAVALRPDVVDLHVYLAELTQRNGDLPEAVRIMEQLIAQHPSQQTDLNYRLGVIYGAAGQDDRALEIMIKVLEGEGRDDARVLNYVGYTWADKGVQLAEAETMIRRAVELEPEDGAIADSLGWVLYKRGVALRQTGKEVEAVSSLEAAVTELERAVRLEPRDPTILRHLGDAQRSLAHNEEALEIYRRALEYTEESQANELRREIELLEGQLKGARSGDAR